MHDGLLIRSSLHDHPMKRGENANYEKQFRHVTVVTQELSGDCHNYH